MAGFADGPRFVSGLEDETAAQLDRRIDPHRVLGYTTALAVHAAFALLLLLPRDGGVAAAPRPPPADDTALVVVFVETQHDEPLPAVGSEPAPSRVARPAPRVAAPQPARAPRVETVATRVDDVSDRPPAATPELAHVEDTASEPALPAAPQAPGTPTNAAHEPGDSQASADSEGDGDAIMIGAADDVIGLGGRGRGKGYKPIRYRGVPLLPRWTTIPLTCQHDGGCMLLVRLFVAADGTRGEIQMLRGSGSPQYDRRILAFAERWTFHPRRVDGVPVDGWAVVPVRAKPTRH